MAGLQAILFDFGGTLDSDGVAWPRRLFSIYRESGIEAGWDAFLEAFYRSDDTLASRHDLRGLDLEETVRLQTAIALERLAPGRPELAKPIARTFATQSRQQMARNRPLLERLKLRFRLGVVSNFFGNLSDILKAEGFGKLFEAVADSGVVGVLKPDPLIFNNALGRLGAEAGAALMVGDSLPRDMRGAEGLGMMHAWLDVSEAPPCCAKGARLRSLLELESVLDAVAPGAAAARRGA